MKTHLININYTACFINHIACFALLLTVMAVTRGTAFAQWNGETYYTDQTINMTGDVTVSGTMTISGCNVTINANGGDRTITRPNTVREVFKCINGGRLVMNGGNYSITINGQGLTYSSDLDRPAIRIESNCSCELTSVTLYRCVNEYFYFPPGGNIWDAIDNLYDGGAIYCMGGTITINNVTIQSCMGDDGAGIYAENSTVTVKGNSLFQSNSSESNGGGLYAKNSTVTIMPGCVFDANGCYNAGAGMCFVSCSVEIQEDVVVSNNKAQGGYGGGIYVDSDGGAHSSVTLKKVEITANSARAFGGGIYIEGTLNVYGGAITDNKNATTSGTFTIGARGGGIYVAAATVGTTQVNITNSGNDRPQISGNIGFSGAGIYSFGDNVTISLNNVDVVDNIAPSANASNTPIGGGIYMNNGGTNGGTLVVTGETQVVNNITRDASNAETNSNVEISTSATNKFVTIGNNGLDCGSSIGITKSSDFTGASPSDYTVIATGSNANCIDAFVNHYFFDDTNTHGVYTSSISPYSTTNLYFFGTGLGNSWANNASALGCTVNSGYVTHVNNAAGLAYLAKDISTGKNYSGKTVLLTADINLSGHNWEPIGINSCSGYAFTGTFNGQGHTIIGLNSVFPYEDMGLFGYVDGGTIQNVFLVPANTEIVSASGSNTLGGLVGYLHGGTVSNCEAAVTLTGGSGTIVGGLVGKADSYTVSGTTYASTIHSCCAMPTFGGGGTVGGLVGQLASGCSLKNSFSNTASGTPGLVGSNAGTVNNCYVRTTTSFIGSGTAVTNCYALGSASGDYTATQTPYLYKHNDNLVVGADASLLATLNAGRESGHTEWTRTMASPINGDYPLLMMPNTTCVGSTDGRVLQYGTDLNTLMTNITDATGHNIYLYGNAGSQNAPITAANANRGIYIAEDAALIHTSTIAKAHVGVTLDPTNGSEGVHWHMFSPSLSKAPLGINYGGDTQDWGFSLTHPSGMPYYLFTQKSEADATYGYFPSHDYTESYPNGSGSPYNYYSKWDFYTYYEPEYHWINFKRNGNSHHHEDSNNEHIDYHWDNNTGNAASLNLNEPSLVRGKGYLVATNDECILEAKGALNQGTFDIPVTMQGAYRTGYNFLGNPYQSYFDFDKFADENQALWGGNKNNASYILLNKDGYTYYAYSGSANQITTSANRYLHPHQGFMIVATNAGTATFTNAMRSTTAVPFRGGDHIDYPLVNLIVTEADGNRDIATVELGRPEAGGALKQHDLRLGKGQIYVHYGENDYAIAFTQPGLSEVGIRFETDEDAIYTLTWDVENGDFSYLHLVDNITGTDIDCLAATEYRFAAKSSDYKSRFKLMFGYTGIEENGEDDHSTSSSTETTFAYYANGEINLTTTSTKAAQLQIIDMTGRVIVGRDGAHTVPTLGMAPGVYVLRLKDNNGTRIQKIVIR